MPKIKKAYFFERKTVNLPDLVVIAQSGPVAWRRVRNFIQKAYGLKGGVSLRRAKDDYCLRKATLA